MENTPLTPVKPLPTFWEARRTFFPSEGSLSWFVRTHRSRLVEDGALLLMRGAWHVHEERFERAMLEIAREEAAKWIDKGEVQPTAA